MSIRSFFPSTVRGGDSINPDFVAVWDTRNTSTGSSASNEITLPYKSSGTYTGVIDWGDGNTSVNSFANRTHVYVSQGIYEIKIRGNVISGFSFSGAGDRLKILDIKNWGLGISWPTTEAVSAFFNCLNLNITAQDLLDFESMGTTTLFQFFRSCPSLTRNDFINNWKVRGVLDFSNIFRQTNFPSPIWGWDIRDANGLSMFNTSNYTTEFYDLLLINWSLLPVKPNISLSVGTTCKYSSGAAATARGVLTGSPNNWTITDGGPL